VAKRGAPARVDALSGLRLVLDGRFIQQHDGDVIFHGIDAAALCALQALRILPVFERLFAGGANQDFEEIFGNHDEHCMPGATAEIDTKKGVKPKPKSLGVSR
jgi:hypothetical protein